MRKYDFLQKISLSKKITLLVTFFCKYPKNHILPLYSIISLRRMFKFMDFSRLITWIFKSFDIA